MKKRINAMTIAILMAFVCVFSSGCGDSQESSSSTPTENSVSEVTEIPKENSEEIKKENSIEIILR